LAAPLVEPSQRERFRREADIAARLAHPRIVPIYDVGEVDGRPYFTMQLLHGVNLAERVIRDGPFEPRAAAAVLTKVAEAVDYAHSQSVIHRDLKPANIMLGVDGEPTVTDFGLARPIEADGPTQYGQVLGTPSYMAPEQADGGQVGAAADVCALGATLYYLITGRPPFRAATSAETLRQVVEAEPAAVRRLNAACPRDLETIVHKCLDKIPARRYSVAELAADLKRFLRGEPIAGRPVSAPERAARWLWRHPVYGVLFARVWSLISCGSRVGFGPKPSRRWASTYCASACFSRRTTPRVRDGARLISAWRTSWWRCRRIPCQTGRTFFVR